MSPTRGSRTAEFMALFRALESRRSARLFEDPFAYGFLGAGLRAVVRAASMALLGGAVPAFIDRRWPGARSSGVARTRLIDDAMIAALRHGVRQVVLLGAGFDARGYRLRGVERVRLFEVDHPATQTVKRARLQAALGHEPAHVRFVPVDFDRERLEDALAAAELDLATPTFFVWEGVTNYLTAAAVDGTLRVVARAAAGSRLVFTYVERRVFDADGGAAAFAGTTRLRALLRRSGEPWTFGLDPATLADYLGARGLQLIEDVGAAEYRARYWGAAARAMHGYEFYHVAVANVRAG